MRSTRWSENSARTAQGHPKNGSALATSARGTDFLSSPSSVRRQFLGVCAHFPLPCDRPQYLDALDDAGSARADLDEYWSSRHGAPRPVVLQSSATAKFRGLHVPIIAKIPRNKSWTLRISERQTRNGLLPHSRNPAVCVSEIRNVRDFCVSGRLQPGFGRNSGDPPWASGPFLGPPCSAFCRAPRSGHPPPGTHPRRVFAQTVRRKRPRGHSERGADTKAHTHRWRCGRRGASTSRPVTPRTLAACTPLGGPATASSARRPLSRAVAGELWRPRGRLPDVHGPLARTTSTSPARMLGESAGRTPRSSEGWRAAVRAHTTPSMGYICGVCSGRSQEEAKVSRVSAPKCAAGGLSACWLDIWARSWLRVRRTQALPARIHAI